MVGPLLKISSTHPGCKGQVLGKYRASDPALARNGYQDRISSPFLYPVQYLPASKEHAAAL